jgi:Nucleotidyl transferase of unknown function (DUF2204)
VANIFNSDFRDFLKALNENKVNYILVGGYAVVLHGYPRTTGDMDLWVERSLGNYRKLEKAFAQFGMPVFDMNEQNFLSHPVWDVFTFGNPPVAIDIMTRLEGLDFNTAFDRSVIFEDEELEIRTIHKNDLILLKKSAGRSKDLNDLENL